MLVSPFYDTAPEHASERAMASYALLDSLHIPYQRIEHEKAETMEVCAAVSDALGVRICKNLFLCNRQQTSFYLLTMPEDKPFHTKDLSHQIGGAAGLLARVCKRAGAAQRQRQRRPSRHGQGRIYRAVFRLPPL